MHEHTCKPGKVKYIDKTESSYRLSHSSTSDSVHIPKTKLICCFSDGAGYFQ